MNVQKQTIKKYALIITCLLLTLDTKAQYWHAVGITGFSEGPIEAPTIAITGSGIPYVAYTDWTAGVAINAMKFDGSNWILAGAEAFSGDEAHGPTLAIDRSGTPYVIYQDFAYAYSYATVMKLSDTSWTFVDTPGISAGCSDFNSIAIGDSDMPYIVLGFDNTSCTGQSSVMKYNGTAWVTVGSPRFTAGDAWSTSLAIDTTGTPYLAYEDFGNSKKATVMKFNGTDWVNVGIPGFSAGSVFQTSIAIDQGGTPYVVYQDSANGEKVTVMKFNGTDWVTVGSAGFSVGIAGLGVRSIAIDGAGTPYVTYEDGGHANKATVMKFNGTSWATVGSPGISTGGVQYPSIAINGSGTLYVAYADSVDSDKVTVMEFSTASGVKNTGNQAATSMSLFPDPNHGIFTLNLSSAVTENAAITITDMFGRKVKELTTITNTNTELQLDVPAGLYFISTIINDESINAKIIVE